MANYVQGIFSGNPTMDSNATGVYNLLVSGGQNYQKSSGIYIANNTLSKPGINIAFSSSNDMTVDHNASAGNNMAFRFGSNGQNYVNMLVLTNDMMVETRGPNAYAGTFNGRVQATQYFINANQNDTMRTSNLETGLYMNSNNTGNYFISNVSDYVISSNGTLFKFMATNGTGDLHGNESKQWEDSDGGAGLNRWRKDTKMEIFYNGIVQLPRYQKTTDAYDVEKTAFAGFDSKGNLVRDFKSNQRLRVMEDDIQQMNLDFMNGLTQKVNNIIGRVNGLNFFSDTILEYRLPPCPKSTTTISQAAVFAGGENDKFTVAIERDESADETTTGNLAVSGRNDANFWDASAHGHITYTVEVSYMVSSNQKYLLTHTGIESETIISGNNGGGHVNTNREITMKYTHAYEGTAGEAPSAGTRWWNIPQTVKVINTTGLSNAELAGKQFTVKIYAVAKPPTNGSLQHVASVHAPSQFDVNTSYGSKNNYISDTLYPDNKAGISADAIKENKSLKSIIRHVNPVEGNGLSAIRKKQ